MKVAYLAECCKLGGPLKGSQEHTPACYRRYWSDSAMQWAGFGARLKRSSFSHLNSDGNPLAGDKRFSDLLSQYSDAFIHSAQEALKFSRKVQP
jgi:hypothetical protein